MGKNLQKQGKLAFACIDMSENFVNSVKEFFDSYTFMMEEAIKTIDDDLIKNKVKDVYCISYKTVRDLSYLRMISKKN